jgi:hypothetical protein
MPRLPHESLPCAQCTKPVRCTPCPYSKNSIKVIVKKASTNIRKHIVIYSFFYILLMEVSSIFLSNTKNYLTYWFPLLSTSGYFVLFLNLFLLRDRLKFCLRKTICVLALSFYYLFAIICLVFQFSDELYTSIINYGLLGVVLSTLVLTLYTLKNER